MDYFVIIMTVFLAFRNGQLAKLKGQNQILWIATTVVSFLILWVVGTMVVMFSFYNIDKASAQNPVAMRDAIKAITEQIATNPLQEITVYLFGVGGYLLMRFLLERMPAKNNDNGNNPGEDINWMDKYSRKEEQ